MNVVFDLGRVLLNWDPYLLFREIMPDEARLQRFVTEVFTLEWLLARDRGSSFAEGAAEASLRYPEFAMELRALDERWHDTLPNVIEGTAQIVEELHQAGVPLYSITNFNDEKFRETLPRFPVLRRFRDIVVSGDEHLLKPEAAIYHVLLERNGLAAEDCLFIDDNIDNVRGAEAVGMSAHHFTSPQVLRRELVQRRILPL